MLTEERICIGKPRHQSPFGSRFVKIVDLFAFRALFQLSNQGIFPGFLGRNAAKEYSIFLDIGHGIDQPL
ncbi:MAG: hypothetical protein ACREJN_16315 [Nitrospiraceae bacterium]